MKVSLKLNGYQAIPVGNPGLCLLPLLLICAAGQQGRGRPAGVHAGAGRVDQGPEAPGLKRCGKISTDEVLGYDIESNEPVHREFCAGSCDSTKDPRTCQAEHKYEKVRTFPVWPDVEIGTSGEATLPPELPAGIPAFKTVKRIGKCRCLLSPCLLNNGATSVPHGGTAYNECGERCECVKGQLLNCCRIRKSVVHMPKAERERYVDAHRGISTGAFGTAMKDKYDALIEDHYVHWNTDIHYEEWFLPWHRHYLLLFENLLREAAGDCRIAVPYWAAELDHSDPWGSPLWNGSPHWYGGGSGGGCVPDGAFAGPWVTTPSDGEGCLRRDRSGGVPSPVDAALLLGTPPSDFATFHYDLNFIMHGGVHCAIDGTMCGSSPQHSANAPEFFLWHGWVDRMWDKWQAQSPAHAGSYSVSVPLSSLMTPGSLAEGRVADFMNSKAQGVEGGPAACATYQDPRFVATVDVIGTLSKMPRDALLTVPSSSSAPMLAGARKWIRGVSGNMTAVLDADALGDFRGRPTAEQSPGSLPLGASLADLRAALWDLRGPAEPGNRGRSFGRFEVDESQINAALDALEEYELQQQELRGEQCRTT